MYGAVTGHNFILVVTEERTNYLVEIPLCRRTSHKIAEALIYHVFFTNRGPQVI